MYVQSQIYHSICSFIFNLFTDSYVFYCFKTASIIARFVIFGTFKKALSVISKVRKMNIDIPIMLQYGTQACAFAAKTLN